MSNKDFLQSYKELASTFRSLLLADYEPDTLLSIAKLYGGLCWANHDTIYSDEEAESLLTKRLAPYFNDELNHCKKSTGDDVIVITSVLYDAFGHSAVVDKWLKVMGPIRQHKLIVTRSIADGMANKINGYGVSLHKCASRGMAGIKEIIHTARNANLIIMHTHPDDIESVIAARLLKSMGITIIFYNHADHVFSYGISCADIVCEISLYGLRISDFSNRVLGKSFFLGIPLTQTHNTINDFETTIPAKANLKTILSCGSSYKYKPVDGFDFNDLINQMLIARNDVQIVLVGPSGEETWWADSISQWGERLKFTGVISSDNYKQLLRTAYVYIDSSPISGGTAFPEALLEGVPTLGLMVPIQGYTFADELRVENTDSLVTKICLLLNNDAATLANMEHVRKKVASHQAEDAFRLKLDNLYSLNSINSEYVIDSKHYSEVNDSFFHDNWLRNKRISLLTRAIRELPTSIKFRVLTSVIKNIRFVSTKTLFETLWEVVKTTCKPAFTRRVNS